MKTIKYIFCFVFMIILSNTFVFAHSATITEIEGTTLEFGFSDGSIMAGAKVYIYDSNGENIAISKTNSKGIYDYAEFVDTAVEIVGNDGEGHIVSYDVVNKISENNHTNNNVIIVSVLSCVIVFGIIMVIKKKKNKNV